MTLQDKLGLFLALVVVAASFSGLVVGVVLSLRSQMRAHDDD